MKKNIFIIFIVIFLIITNSINVYSKTKIIDRVDITKNVLHLTSTSLESTNYYHQIKAIDSNIVDNAIVNTIPIYNDENTKKPEEELLSLIKYRMNENKVDLIMSSGVAMGEFVLKYREELFKDIPVVFFSIDNSELLKKISKTDNNYCVFEDITLQENIQFINIIHNPKRIILMIDSLELTKEEKKTLNEITLKNKKLKIIDIYKKKDVIKYIYDNNLFMDGDVLLVGKSISRNNNYNIATKVENNFFNNLGDIPKYSMVDYIIGNNFIGGFVISQFKEAKIASKLANEILLGRIIDEKYINSKDTNIGIFNYDMLKKYGIKRSYLPKNAIILNDPLKELYENKILVLMAILIYVSLIVFIILLVVNIYLKIKHDKYLIKYNSELAKYNKSKFSVINNITEELKFNVYEILEFSDLAYHKLDNFNELSNPKENTIKTLKTNCYREIRIINNMIDVSKKNVNNILKLKNTNINNLLKEIINLSQKYANKKNINIVLTVQKNEIISAVDIDKIERIILNLISNSIKFSFENSIINVRLYKFRKNFIIEIKDYGIGIEKKYIKDIFEVFEQLDKSMTRQNEGSGIGLSVVKNFVDLHDGDVKVHSQKNKGTKIKVYIPIISVNENENKFEKIDNSICKADIELADIY